MNEAAAESGPIPSLDQTPQRPPWTAAEVFFLYFLSALLSVVTVQVLRTVGLFEWFYGAEFVTLAFSGQRSLAMVRVGLWVTFFGSVAQIVATILFLLLVSKARFVDLGLTTRGLWRQVAAGGILAVIIVPGAYALYFYCLWGLELLGVSAEEHPFTKMGKGGLMSVEWGLLIVAAVVIAPLWEELFYRGIVQPLVCAEGRVGSVVTLGVAFALTLSLRWSHLSTSFSTGTGVMLELLPLLCLLATVPIWAIIAARDERRGGVFATAVLFAWIHAGVWPSPIPLLWLAVALGWLREKSDSLVGPIVLHALFNAVACVALVVNVSK